MGQTNKAPHTTVPSSVVTEDTAPTVPGGRPDTATRRKAFADFLPADRRREFVERPVVCVQGLGFVGAAMAMAVANSRDGTGQPRFNVIGIDLDNAKGRAAIGNLNEGRFPFQTTDRALIRVAKTANAIGNFVATSCISAYSLAEVVLVDINLDLTVAPSDGGDFAPMLHLDGFKDAIATLAETIEPGTLVIVETTVPPGTCARIVAPMLAEGFEARGLDKEAFLLAHAYERVMPGERYLESIVNYWRIYAGHTSAAATACSNFLSQVIDVERFPLRRLSSTTASETAKVLENSYRAVNIAFIEEWGRFADSVGIDLFEVIEAVRQRETHSNIRQPGFGVGGYCLPKDPLMAIAAARDIFALDGLDFPFCRLAFETNRQMPMTSVEALTRLLGGNLEGKRIGLLGVSYRHDVADTRTAPAALFVTAVEARGAKVLLHDPLVNHWPELGAVVSSELPAPAQVDALVFGTAHAVYRTLDPTRWLAGARPAVLDTNDVLTAAQRLCFRQLGCRVASIGRGEEAA